MSGGETSVIIPGFFFSPASNVEMLLRKQQLCVDAEEIRNINGHLNLTLLVWSQTAQTRADIFLMLQSLNV